MISECRRNNTDPVTSLDQLEQHVLEESVQAEQHGPCHRTSILDTILLEQVQAEGFLAADPDTTALEIL